MQEGKRPISVGFFFSLGHSTVVIGAAILIALTASTLQRSFPGLIEAGGLVGTLVSVIFLFAIATINFVVLVGVLQVFRRAKASLLNRPSVQNVMLRVSRRDSGSTGLK